MAEGDVLYEKEGQLAIITINRPHRMNALTMAGWTHEMASIWDDFNKDRSLRVAILTAVGDRAFCAGVDVKETAERNASGEKHDPNRQDKNGWAALMFGSSANAGEYWERQSTTGRSASGCWYLSPRQKEERTPCCVTRTNALPRTMPSRTERTGTRSSQ